MKRLLIGLMISISLNLVAQEWEMLWIKAIEACDKEDFSCAENYFNKAIEIIEEEDNQNYPNVYVDRARLYLALNEYQKVILDIDRAVSIGSLRLSDQVHAIATRVAAKALLGHTEGIINSYYKFQP